MVATTDIGAHPPAQLKHGVLNKFEMMGQSIANIAPTMTPALNISVVAGLAGVDAWVAYLIATIGLVFVGACISVLARRHPEAGSYFVYIGRNFGPVTGALAGWAMVLAYITTAVAVVFGMPLFLSNLLVVFHITLTNTELIIITILILVLVIFAAYRDIQLSSRAALALESISVGIIVIITAIVIGKHGTVVDTIQLDTSKIKFDTVMPALVFGVFSFVGFESAATLAKESADPKKNVPFAVIGSAAVAGIFFVILSYCMIMGMNDDTSAIGNSSSPFAAMTDKAGLPGAAAVVYFAAIASAFACALACINASSRILYSLGRYQFLHRSMGLVHKTHKTPHMAVLASGAIALIVILAALPEGFLNAFGLSGTIATYGFVTVYFGVCITAPVDAFRNSAGNPLHIMLGILGAVLMGFVIYSSVSPYPAPPFNILPPIFLVYMVIGLVWFLTLKVNSPQVLISIANDMEG